ncbi:glycosyltransferase family 8 protein [Devosia sp.]|uniref:glycosyltransferase family 8 protein n=1 Tax=Devosia sp. TaxID=1871048 RepID=UPI003266BD98
MSQDLHIALTFDDNFWAPAYATMRSVCLFTHRHGDLVFHLLHRTLSDEHVADLRQIETEFGARLVFYDLDQSPLFSDIAARMPVNKRLTNIVYARLVIDRLLPADVARVLYLDCDMMVRAPIEELYDLDLQGFPIAAVRDVAGAIIVGGRDLRANRDIFDIADPYFNAGMLLIDVAGWRAADIIGKMEGYLKSGVMARIYYDQDLLNLVFKNNWLRLPFRWNLMDARAVHEALDPALLHYTGGSRPWHLVSNTAFRRTYRHVMTNELFYRFMRHRWKQFWRKQGRKLSGRN